MQETMSALRATAASADSPVSGKSSRRFLLKVGRRALWCLRSTSLATNALRRRMLILEAGDFHGGGEMCSCRRREMLVQKAGYSHMGH